MISDGCSGFWLLELFFNIHDCCVVHDNGGSDELLLTCLLQNTPAWAAPAVAVCVAIMVFFRPVYHWIKRALKR